MVQVVDETKKSYPPALKQTLQDVLSHLPPDLVKGVHRIVVQDAMQDPAALRQMPDALSQYIPRGRESVIRLYMGNILLHYRKKFLIRWRPTTRARLIARALSHALVYHKHGGAQKSGTFIAQESKGIQLVIFKHWLEAYPFSPWMKEFILERMRRQTAAKAIKTISVLMFLWAFEWTAVGAPGPAKKATISAEGEIVDVACYMGHRVPSAKHPRCTKSCLMDGKPIGLLVEGRDLYLLLEDAANPKVYQTLKQSATERVQASGVVSARGGLRTLTVQDVTVLKESSGACTEQADTALSGSGYCGESLPVGSH